MRKKGFLLLVLLLLFAPFVKGQAPVRVSMDSTQALIGSPLTLRLDAGPLPAGTAVAWPQVPDSFRALVRAGEPKTDTIETGGQVRYLREYPFVGLDSGIFEVPALTFGVGGQTVQSAPVSVYLYPMDVDTTKPIEPIRDIIAAPDYVNWKPWAIGLGVALLVALALWMWLRRKKKAPLPLPQMPPKGFMVLLKELEAEGLPQRGEYRQFYTRLTDIVRDAMAVKGGFKTREITSAQLLRRSGKVLEGLPQQQLRAILEEADAVKFARLQPTLTQGETALQTAYAFIQNLKL